MTAVPDTPPAVLLVHAHPDDEVTTTGLTMARAVDVTVRAPELVQRKLAAFRAHASQIAPDSPFFRMAELFGPQAWGTEWFRFAGGVPVPAGATDIFAGL